ncbi:MAG: acetyltransferase [Frankiales bacterium]|nr:acetyltransferase [Frankiales bacterium]
MSSSSLAGAVVRRSAPLARRWRRALLVRRIRVLAAAAHASVDVQIATDALVARGIRVDVGEGTTSTLRIATGAAIGEGVVLQLRGGSIEVGPWSDLRRGVVLNVSGDLRVGERTVLGAGTTVHCAHAVTIGDRVGIGEYTTLVDTSHRHTQPDRPVVYDTVEGSVVVGDDAFIGTKSTLTRDCRVGPFAFVGAGSTVIGDVPAKTFVSGVPAREISAVELPWE